MYPNYVGNLGANAANTGPGPSPYLWRHCPWHEIDGAGGGAVGYRHFYNFEAFKAATNVNAAEALWSDGFYVFGSDGYAVTAGSDPTGAANAFGYVTVGSDGDNEGGSIRRPAVVRITGPNATASARVGDFWMEARIKTSTITDTKHGIFLGLIEDVAATATVPITAAGALADKNLVGFHRLEGDGDMFDCVYKADGVTQVTVQADAQTIVADTWIKLGLNYNSGNSTLYWMANGVVVASKVIPAAAGTDFPNDINLGFIFSQLNATGTTPGTSSIDWMRIAQVAA